MTSESDDDEFARQFSGSMHKLLVYIAAFISFKYLSLIIKQENDFSRNAFEYQ